MAFKLSPAHKEPPKGRLKKFIHNIINPKGGQVTGGRGKGKQTFKTSRGEIVETTPDQYSDEERMIPGSKDKTIVRK